MKALIKRIMFDNKEKYYEINMNYVENLIKKINKCNSVNRENIIIIKPINKNLINQDKYCLKLTFDNEQWKYFSMKYNTFEPTLKGIENESALGLMLNGIVKTIQQLEAEEHLFIINDFEILKNSNELILKLLFTSLKDFDFEVLTSLFNSIDKTEVVETTEISQNDNEVAYRFEIKIK